MRKINWKVKGSRKQWIENLITLEKEFRFPVYDCYVLVDDEKKLILKIDCECWNFQNKRMKEFGFCAYKKIYAEPCKHLKKITEALEKIGYKFKIPKMEGTDKPTAELKRLLIERSEGICERKGCNNPIQEIHRQIPGVMGGKYNGWNCVYLCGDCHNLIPRK